MSNHEIVIWDANGQCYRQYDEYDFTIDGKTLDEHNKKIYNKAIDDFESKILCNCAAMLKDGERVIVVRMDIFKFIIDQLKKGGKNEQVNMSNL